MLQPHSEYRVIFLNHVFLPSSGEYIITRTNNKKSEQSMLFDGKVRWNCTHCKKEIAISSLRENTFDFIKYNDLGVKFTTGVLYLCESCNDILYYFGYGTHLVARSVEHFNKLMKNNILSKLYSEEQLQNDRRDNSITGTTTDAANKE